MAKSPVKELLISLIKSLKDYYLFVPIIIYGVGFVFVQGMFSPFTHSFIFESIHLIVPVSYELYLINGLFCSIIILFSFICSYLFFSVVVNSQGKFNLLLPFIKIKYKKALNMLMFKIELAVNILRIVEEEHLVEIYDSNNTTEEIGIPDASFEKKEKRIKTFKLADTNFTLRRVVLLTILIPLLIYMVIELKIESFENLNIAFFVLFIIIFFTIFYLYEVVRNKYQHNDLLESVMSHTKKEGFKYTESKVDNAKNAITYFNKNSDANEMYFRSQRHTLNSSILMIKVFAFISFCVMIYFYGLYSQSVKVTLFSKGIGSYDMATVTIDKDSRPKTYLYMDMNKDYFIGYSSGSVFVFPTKTIFNVEKHSMNFMGDFIKGDKNSNNILFTKINNYYSPYLEKHLTSGKDYIRLFSKKYYADNMDLISPEILEKTWTNDDDDDLIDYDISEPVFDKKNGNYSIYVKEYCKKGRYKKRFTMMKDKITNEWQIDSILENDSFDFK